MSIQVIENQKIIFSSRNLYFDLEQVFNNFKKIISPLYIYLINTQFNLILSANITLKLLHVGMIQNNVKANLRVLMCVTGSKEAIAGL